MKDPARRGPGFWAGQMARRASPGDAIGAAVVALLGFATLGAGYRARQVLAPRSSVEVASALDDLEAPRRLPDAPLRDDLGVTAGLWERIKGERAIVVFYADWCGPCQKELPEVVEQLADSADVIVVVDAGGAPDARRQIDNLGLGAVRVHADVTGALAREGRVTALPTTYLVGRKGHVLGRMVGAGSLWPLYIKILHAERLFGDRRGDAVESDAGAARDASAEGP
jgi:thiol-disulfide isomerase/thioredoxin